MFARLNGHVDYSTLGKPCAIDDCTVHGKNCGGNAPDNGPAGTKGRPGGALPASTGNRRVSTRVDENRRRDEPATALTAPVSAEGPAGGGAPEVRSQSSRNAETGPGACGATRRHEARHEDAEAADGRRFARAWCGSARTSKNSAAVREVRPVRGSAGGGGVLARASGADAPPKHAGMAYTRSFHAAFHRTIDHPAPLLGRTFKVQTNHRKLLDVFQNRPLGNTKSIRHHLGLQPIVGFNHFQN